MKILITGSAGFIGFHLAKKLLSDTHNQIIGLDNLNNYYSVKLKEDRLKQLNEYRNFKFYKIDISDKKKLEGIFINEKFDVVINLAAQAGVRYSIENPQVYIDSNIVGFHNILECCRHSPVNHLIYASSSSVYGGNSKIPFSSSDNVDHPVSLYAATKKSNELMAHSYSNLYNIPTTGLRFFTVYGPWGRPDMAYFSFTKNIIEGKTIQIFNNGQMERDFTYIDDIVIGISKLIGKIPNKNQEWNELVDSIDSSWAPYKIYNIGNNKPIKLLDFVTVLEKEIGLETKKQYMPMQKGDVKRTYADISSLEKDIDFRPSTSINYGLKEFVKWYKSYYNV